MASATFHYRAIAADGKLRSGVITAENGKTVARELIRQGLTPVYVGSGEKKSAALKLSSFGGGGGGVTFSFSPRNFPRC